MGEIIELRQRETSSVALGAGDTEIAGALDALEHSARGLVASAERMVETLEASLKCIRARIDAIPESEISGRLEKEHAILSAALQTAKAQVAAIGRSTPKL